MTTQKPLVVRSLDEVDPVDGRWVHLLGRGRQLYVAKGGKWVLYERPPEPDLWSHLTGDDDP